VTVIGARLEINTSMSNEREQNVMVGKGDESSRSRALAEVLERLAAEMNRM
jgi:hypothetical protein